MSEPLKNLQKKEASFSPPNHKWLGYPKNTIYMKYLKTKRCKICHNIGTSYRHGKIYICDSCQNAFSDKKSSVKNNKSQKKQKA
jgi:hypothetical protein